MGGRCGSALIGVRTRNARAGSRRPFTERGDVTLFPLLARMVVENLEITFDVDGGTDHLYVELLGVNVVARQNTLHHP